MTTKETIRDHLTSKWENAAQNKHKVPQLVLDTTQAYSLDVLRQVTEGNLTMAALSALPNKINTTLDVFCKQVGPTSVSLGFELTTPMDHFLTYLGWVEPLIKTIERGLDTTIFEYERSVNPGLRYTTPDHTGIPSAVLSTNVIIVF